VALKDNCESAEAIFFSQFSLYLKKSQVYDCIFTNLPSMNKVALQDFRKIINERLINTKSRVNILQKLISTVESKIRNASQDFKYALCFMDVLNNIRMADDFYIVGQMEKGEVTFEDLVEKRVNLFRSHLEDDISYLKNKLSEQENLVRKLQEIYNNIPQEKDYSIYMLYNMDPYEGSNIKDWMKKLEERKHLITLYKYYS